MGVYLTHTPPVWFDQQAYTQANTCLPYAAELQESAELWNTSYIKQQQGYVGHLHHTGER